MNKVELLSPVGNMECLIQAVNNGADAVYLGGKKFGARHYANNFDYDEMIEAIKYCHLYGVKIYVTVNTIVFEKELDEVLKFVEFLHSNQVDAIIVQDLGLIRIIRKKFPNMEIHASTQAHNHNDYGLSLLKSLGVKRAVLARELSLKEIKNLKTDIDKEVFIHGALCVSYSGCCLFSAMHGSRSGNRGECVGSCRLPYKLYENGNEIKTNGDYLLSTKSLCTINDLDKLIDSGIKSFKIEGRMKSSEYVGYITRLYRVKIDEYYFKKKYNVTEEEITNIKKLYNRELTGGYLFDNYGHELMNIKTSNHIGTNLGKVISIDKKYIKIRLSDNLYQEDAIRFNNGEGFIVNKLYNEKGLLTNQITKGSIALVDNKLNFKNNKNIQTVRKTIDINLNKSIRKLKEKKIEVKLLLKALIGKQLELSIDDGENSITKYGSIVEEAKSSPTDYERIKSQIEKLGETPFISIDTSIEMDNNIFIPIKELNELRRELTSELIEKRSYKEVNKVIKNDITEIKHNKKDIPLCISALIRNEDQLKVLIDNKIDTIYTDSFALYEKYKDKYNIYFKTKRVSDNNATYKNEKLLATELGACVKYSKDNEVISDYYLNVTNRYSIEELNDIGVKKITLSVESDKENTKYLSSMFSNIELIIYGRIELMVSKYCPMNMLINRDEKKCNLCDINNYSLKDKDDNVYPIINEKHLTHILDSKPIDLTDDLEDYMDYGIRNYRLELFDESEEEIKNLISVIRYSYEHRNNK